MQSFAQLLDRLYQGDEQAATQIVERYRHRLVGLAKSKIGARLRAKIDPEDVVQSAFRSFFEQGKDKPFDLADWEDLWGLLSLITLRQCFDRVEHFQSQRRDAHREVKLEMTKTGSATQIPLAGREPAPEDAMELYEAVDQVLRGFDGEDRAVVERCLQGYTTAEISHELQRAERTVRRLRERVRDRLLRMIEQRHQE